MRNESSNCPEAKSWSRIWVVSGPHTQNLRESDRHDFATLTKSHSGLSDTPAMSMSRPQLAKSTSRARSNSSSSSMPSSPGPSISIRTTRSSTPTPGLSPTSSYTNVRSHGKGPQYGSGTSGMGSGIGIAGRERSATQMSSSTIGTSSTKPAHSRQRPTLMGRNSSSRLGRNHLQQQQPSTPPVPPILINGSERPEDVDVAAIGRLASGPEDQLQQQLPYASNFHTTPESTAAGVDSLFMRFGVKDVKAIANRGRVKAEGKREELRTMVGERYRDLISAADSIVRMRKSSSALTSKLSTARDECDRDIMVARAADEGELVRHV